MAGGTFTITNVGVFGIDARHADHQPGRVGDPRGGRLPRAAVGAQGPGQAALGGRSSRCRFDHRHIDGALGSRFLAAVAGVLEDPAAAVSWA